MGNATSARSWKKSTPSQGSELTLPSENVALVRPLSPQAFLAGGFIPDANEKEMYIVRANGAAEGGYARARTVSVGDTIVVPERIESKTRSLPLWQSIASIIGSAALTAAAIAVIGR